MKNKEKSVSHRLPCEASAKRGTATVGLYPCTAGLCVSVALWQIWANMASRRLRYPLPAFAGLPAIPTSSLDQAKNHQIIGKFAKVAVPPALKNTRFLCPNQALSANRYQPSANGRGASRISKCFFKYPFHLTLL
jgi:hypothetical protein